MLGGLPLVGEQAAAYCERLEISLAEYARRFAATPVRMLDSEKDAPTEFHDRLTVAKAFALAIGEAAKQHPAAEALILHVGLLAPEPIPLFLFADARQHFDEPMASSLAGDGLDEAILALRAFALVDREAIRDERDPIRLHRLVREISAALGDEVERVARRRSLIACVVANYPEDVFNETESWPRARRLDALSFGLVSDAALSKDGELPASELMDRLATYWQGALGVYDRAQLLYERALAIREKALGPNHIATAASLSSLAKLLRAQGDFAAAIAGCSDSRARGERGPRGTALMAGPPHAMNLIIT